MAYDDFSGTNTFNSDNESYVGDDPSTFNVDTGEVTDKGSGYGNINTDTDGNYTDRSSLSLSGYQNAMGITPSNPFGYDNFFSKNFGVDPRNMSYTNILGGKQNTIQQGIDRYTNIYGNPDNERNKAGFNPNLEEDSPRLQKGYGSLFGNPVREPTIYGPMVEQKPDALTGNQTLASMGFSALAPAGIGFLANSLANPSTYATRDRSDPTRNPLSGQYDAETYDKGYMGTMIDTMYGAGLTKQTTDLVTQAMDWAANLGKPENKSMTDPNYKGSAPANITREEVTANPMGAGENLGEAFNTGIANINPEVTDSAKNNMVSDINIPNSIDMIQGPPELTNLKVNNLGLIGAPGYSISGGFDYPGTDRDINTSTSTSTGQVVTFDKDGGFNFEKRYPTEEEAYQKFLKEMYTD